jgi:ABC transporter, ATP-binding protein
MSVGLRMIVNMSQTIRAADLSCRRGSQILVSDINLELNGGSVTGLIGPNGSGKSTFIATMVGDVKPGCGRVEFNGQDVRKLPQRSDVFGVVTEAHGLPRRMKAKEIVRYWTDVHGVSRSYAHDLCQILGVDRFYSKPIKKLSTGMRRRLEIVLALLPNPTVLVLDEPFNGLDLDGVEAVRTLVRDQRDAGKIVLLTTHALTEIDKLADSLYAIHKRKLVKLDFSKGVTGTSEVVYNRLRNEDQE